MMRPSQRAPARVCVRCGTLDTGRNSCAPSRPAFSAELPQHHVMHASCCTCSAATQGPHAHHALAQGQGGKLLASLAGGSLAALPPASEKGIAQLLAELLKGWRAPVDPWRPIRVRVGTCISISPATITKIKVRRAKNLESRLTKKLNSAEISVGVSVAS